MPAFRIEDLLLIIRLDGNFHPIFMTTELLVGISQNFPLVQNT